MSEIRKIQKAKVEIEYKITDQLLNEKRYDLLIPRWDRLERASLMRGSI